LQKLNQIDLVIVFALSALKTESWRVFCLEYTSGEQKGSVWCLLS